ncbi:hypothetical protein PT974_01088 [Cladobotryum mycophilum]|uniref:Uncharacterized protein n=1 Tax=Cladobotryum mycophilum TaxID=491253 RepID=A0ABR0T3Z1_9HYPO
MEPQPPQARSCIDRWEVRHSIPHPSSRTFPEFRGSSIEDHQVYSYLKQIWEGRRYELSREERREYLSLVPRAVFTPTTRTLSTHRIGVETRARGPSLPRFIVLNAMFGRKACMRHVWWHYLKIETPGIESEWPSGPFTMAKGPIIERSPMPAVPKKETDAIRSNMGAAARKTTVDEDTMADGFPIQIQRLPYPSVYYPRPPSVDPIERPGWNFDLAVAQEAARKHLENEAAAKEEIGADELAARYEEDRQILDQLGQQLERIQDKMSNLLIQFVDHQCKMDVMNGKKAGEVTFQSQFSWNMKM